MRLPLDLYAEIEAADGTRYRWDANKTAPDRLKNFSFRTKIGEGFSDATGQLTRPINLDFPDLGLVNNMVVAGADGTVAYEGRISAMPREVGDSHSVGVMLAGWMSHAKDRKFTEVYMDRGASGWTSPSTTRRANILAATINHYDSQATLDPDGAASLQLGLTGSWAFGSYCEAYYMMPPGVQAGGVRWDWTSSNINTADANWTGDAFTVTADGYSGFSVLSSDWLTAATGSVSLAASGQTGGFMVRLHYAIAAGNDGVSYNAYLKNLRVMGDHGLTVRGSTSEEEGFYASDVMADIASRWCPLLDTSGIQNTSYVIGQLAFRERTFPYDGFLELNKYHLWQLAVWEKKRLHFEPYDLTDYDWQIDLNDPGITFSPQGPSTESLFNGIAVTYQDILTGTTNTITPDDNSALADTSSTNPWNQHGIQHWDEIVLSTPDTETGATYLGQAALADRNAPKYPGTITVRGYIRDRAGNFQPAWKVRAGDTITVKNFNDAVRLIVETDYSDEDKTVRLGIDRPFQLLDAYLDRVGNALGARGLA